MAPARLLSILGLCNLVAGALLVFAPAAVAPLAGVDAPAAQLARHSTAALLVAIAIGAWRMPAEAAVPYLWVFGVFVKIVAVGIWAAAALSTGVATLWVGVGVDALIAAVVSAALLLRR